MPDYATFVEDLADKYFHDVYLVQDKLNNINTPKPGSFDESILKNNELNIVRDVKSKKDFEIIYGDGYDKSKGIPLFVFNYLDYKIWKGYYDSLRSERYKEGSKERNDFFNKLGCSDFGLKVFEQFYFSRTRRSLEHYYPQANIEERLITESQINCFGNNASRWRDLIRSNITEIADAHNIDLINLKWYAAFHNTTHHPHIHLMVYSKDESQGWITKRSIEDMRSMFGNEIFRYEQYKLFEIQTEQRNKIKKRFRDLLEHCDVDKFNVSPELNVLFLTLTKQLKTVKGKKVYGYLPKKVKCTVNKIAAEIAKDRDIAELYSKWNDINREKLSLYHEKKTPDIPIEENKEFRSIKNVIIKSAVDYIENDSVQTNESFNDTGFIFSGIILSLLKLFAANYNRHEEKLRGQADVKLRSKIAEKKMAQGIRPQYGGNQSGWEQNM